MDIIFLFVSLNLFIFASAQYTDDSDYNDFDTYNEPPTIKKLSINNFHDLPSPDDFYIVSEDDKSIEQLINLPGQHVNLDKVPEKKYRYTKHRIPGYDYDEIDLIENKNMPSCDERSIRTHCLCQFTCIEQNVKDCYTPCKSGCECKEDFVFDENIQQCVYPEDCSVTNDHFF